MFKVGQQWIHKVNKNIYVIIEVRDFDVKIKNKNTGKEYWVRAKDLIRYFIKRERYA